MADLGGVVLRKLCILSVSLPNWPHRIPSLIHFPVVSPEIELAAAQIENKETDRFARIVPYETPWSKLKKINMAKGNCTFQIFLVRISKYYKPVYSYYLSRSL